MHSLKYFSDTNKQALFAQIENFINNENAEGRSISVEHNGDIVVALLGYTPEVGEDLTYTVVEKSICKVYDSVETIQKSIDDVTAAMGNFVCQSCCIEQDNLSIVFLTAK
ncbi:MAG: hypothetical protein V4649_12320 [Bacteroidota bacterium]